MRQATLGGLVACAVLGMSTAAFAQAEVPFGVDTSPNYNGHTLVPLDIVVGSGVADCPGGGSPCNPIECPVPCDPHPFADSSGTGLYAAMCAGGGGVSLTNFTCYVNFSVPGDVCSLHWAEYRCADNTQTSYSCESWELVASGVLAENITDDTVITVGVPGTLATGHRLQVWITCGDEGGDPQEPPVIHYPPAGEVDVFGAASAAVGTCAQPAVRQGAMGGAGVGASVVRAAAAVAGVVATGARALEPWL